MSGSTHGHPVISPRRRALLVRRIRFLVAFTITYNATEGLVSLLAGAAAGSSALIGFGLDSLIEMSSALIVAWQFSGGRHQERERVALRLIAASFFALAGFVAWDAVTSLVDRAAPDPSTVGIVIAAASLLVMPTVSLVQRSAGHEVGSHSAVADSKQMLLCSYMSAVLLVALLANSLAGWWWADPIGALIIAGLAVREGITTWNGDACCAAAPVRLDRPDEGDTGSDAVASCGPSCTC